MGIFSPVIMGILSPVLTLVLDELRKIVYKRTITRQLIKERSKRMQTNTEDLDGRIKSKEKAIQEKESFLEKCKNDYKRGELAAPLYSEFYEETNKETTVLKSEMKKLKAQLEKATVKIENTDIILSRLQEAVENWENIPNRDKKIIIAAFLPRVEAVKNGDLYVERNIPTTLEGLS